MRVAYVDQHDTMQTGATCPQGLDQRSIDNLTLCVINHMLMIHKIVMEQIFPD